MNHFYTEDYLRSQVSKYANERIQFIGSDGTSIKICFKEGYGTSLITGTVNTEVSVKTMMALKEVCKKSHLIKGEEILKSRQTHKKDLTYYKWHYATAMEEAKTYLKRAESEWDEAEALQKKAAFLQKQALTLKLMILKETKDFSEESVENLLEEIEKNTYGEISFDRHYHEIEGTDFFFKLVCPNAPQSIEVISWDKEYLWGTLEGYNETFFKNSQELLRYIKTL